MYAYRYDFSEWGGYIEIGVWQEDRWPGEDNPGGLAFSSTADIHVSPGQHGPTVKVSVGGTNMAPALAAERAKVYMAAANLGAWIEERLKEGATIPEVGAAVEQLVPNMTPVEELI